MIRHGSTSYAFTACNIEVKKSHLLGWSGEAMDGRNSKWLNRDAKLWPTKSPTDLRHRAQLPPKNSKTKGIKICTPVSTGDAIRNRPPDTTSDAIDTHLRHLGWDTTKLRLRPW